MHAEEALPLPVALWWEAWPLARAGGKGAVARDRWAARAAVRAAAMVAAVARVAMAARAGMRSEVMPWVAVRAATHPLVLLERVVAALERMAGGGKPDQARLRT